jgi:hypothetical protein
MRIREAVVGPGKAEIGYTGTDGTYHMLQDDQLEYSSISTCADIKTKNYAKRINSGEIINNPCTINVVTIDAGVSGHSGIDTAGKTTFTSGGSANFYIGEAYMDSGSFNYTPLSVDLDSMFARARLEALARMDPTPYSFMEDLAELTSTISYLKGSTSKLLKATDDWLASKKKIQVLDLTPFAREKQLASLWLQYRFVLSPMVKSMGDLLEAFNDKSHYKIPFRRTSRGFEQYNEAEIVQQTIPAQTYEWELTRTYSANVTAGVYYETSNPLNGFRFKYGLRNKDIPVTLWNVVPLSFMYDRVQDISNSIKAVTNFLDPSLKVVAGWTRIKRTDEKTYRRTAYNAPTWDFTVYGTPVTHTDFLYERQPWIPSLSDTVPPFEVDKLITDITSLTDVLSLVLGRLK